MSCINHTGMHVQSMTFQQKWYHHSLVTKAVHVIVASLTSCFCLLTTFLLSLCTVSSQWMNHQQWRYHILQLTAAHDDAVHICQQYKPLHTMDVQGITECPNALAHTWCISCVAITFLFLSWQHKVYWPSLQPHHHQF